MANKADLQAIEQWMYSFDWEPHHSLQVRDLVLQFFDQLEHLHGLRQDAREMLEAAAILHDIGFPTGQAKHHKRSYQLIREHNLPGFSVVQREVIANLARYHRKAYPSLSHKGFARLSASDRDLVRRLSSLLRLADGLDRTHMATVRSVECEVVDRRLIIHIKGVGEMGEDIWGAERKRGLFEEVYGLQVEFRHSCE